MDLVLDFYRIDFIYFKKVVEIMNYQFSNPGNEWTGIIIKMPILSGYLLLELLNK